MLFTLCVMSACEKNVYTSKLDCLYSYSTHSDAYSRSQITQFRDFQLASWRNSNHWPLIIQVLLKQLPEIMRYSQNHSEQMTRTRSGMDLTLNKTHILKIICVVYLFCLKLAPWLIPVPPPQKHFVSPMSTICFVPSVMKVNESCRLRESSEICWIQFIFLLPTEPL